MQQAEILELAGLRIDGRRPNEMRPLAHKIGLLPHADGSAYLEQGLNKVLALVMGPHEPRKRTDIMNEKANIICSVEYAPFSGSERKVWKQGDRRVAEFERVLSTAVESVVLTEVYPRSTISIVVHIMENDGSILCTAVNAVVLALMNAGISMSDMLVGCTVGNVKGRLCLDLTQMEMTDGGAVIPVVMKSRSEEIVYVQLDRVLGFEQLEAALNLTIDGCKYVRTYLDNAMKQYMTQQLEGSM